MKYFNIRQDILYAEDCSLNEIAGKFGTPCYVYSRRTIEEAFQEFDTSCGRHPHQICYAVKANSNIAVLNILARMGSGFDIVSGGELARVLKAGGDPQKIIFSGVGKQKHEIIAALNAGIGCFNVESSAELEQLNAIAASLGKVAAIALRVNPDVAVTTHPFWTTGLKENKFGVPHNEAIALYRKASELSHIQITGIACHLGSQIMEVEPYLLALSLLLSLIDELATFGIIISQLDVGGGFGMRYRDEKPAPISRIITEITSQLNQRNIKLILEPGRAIVASAGILLTKMLSLKLQETKKFVITDAGMNDLIRPALYGAYHEIIPVNNEGGHKELVDVVGPVCETGDFLGLDRELAVKPDELLAVTMCGAYGFVMSSNFNTRPRAAEVMVDGANAYLVRQRENLEDLFAGETCLP